MAVLGLTFNLDLLFAAIDIGRKENASDNYDAFPVQKSGNLRQMAIIVPGS